MTGQLSLDLDLDLEVDPRRPRQVPAPAARGTRLHEGDAAWIRWGLGRHVQTVRDRTGAL